MTLGALLIGLAAAILVIAYVLTPFRRAPHAVDVDAQIEAWVAEARRTGGAKPVVTAAAPKAPDRAGPAADQPAPDMPDRAAAEPLTRATTGDTSPSPAAEGKAANFCHHCGEPVRPHHRFCPNCGTSLVEA